MAGLPDRIGKTERDPLVDRAVGAVSAALAALGALWTLALLALINLDVFLRWVFSSPLPAVPEFVALAITGIVFLQLANALRAGKFIKSDALSKAIIAKYPAFDRWSSVAFNLLGAALFGCIAWATVPLLAKAWTRGTFVGAVGDVTFPVWPINLLVICGSTLVSAEYLLHAFRSGRSS